MASDRGWSGDLMTQNLSMLGPVRRNFLVCYEFLFCRKWSGVFLLRARPRHQEEGQLKSQKSVVTCTGGA